MYTVYNVYILFIFRFATRDIMGLYGKVLGNLMTNSDALNEAVFTMMYRVAGECDALDTLFQEAVILVLMDIASCEIWESLPQVNIFCVSHGDQRFFSI